MKNALDQTEGNEVDQSSNQVGARLIETLIKLAPPSALPRFMDIFASNLRVVATNRFASHVLQSLIATVTKFALVSAWHFIVIVVSSYIFVCVRSRVFFSFRKNLTKKRAMPPTNALDSCHVRLMQSF